MLYRAYLCIAIGATVASTSLAGPTDAPPVSGLTNTFNVPAAGQITGKDNVIVLVHGWTSGPQWWPNDFRAKLNGKLGAAAASWDIWVLNWESDAAGGSILGPSNANEVNAQQQGQYLAKTILSQGYDNIHLYGHSLGGRVIESAATVLQQAQSAPIHTTFLDAYTPYNWNGVYGETSTWSEHVVDTYYPPYTNEVFNNTYNVDVTPAKPPKPVDWNEATSYDHHWPRLWYERSIDNYGTNLADPMGWTLSKESGNGGWPHTSFADGQLDTLDADGNVASTSQISPTAVLNAVPIDPQGSGAVLARSSTDRVTISSGIIELDALQNSNEWINLALDITSAANFVEFDFKFLTSEDGLLSFRIDNKLIWAARDFNALTNVWEDTGKLMYTGTLSPGSHWLSYRLDAGADTLDGADVMLRDISAGFLALPEPAMISICVLVLVMRRPRPAM